MCIAKYFSFVCSIHSVFKIREEKGEIFRKSLCCVPCSDSEDDGVGSDAENHKTVKQGKIERNSDNESSRRRKKESHKKVLKS